MQLLLNGNAFQTGAQLLSLKGRGVLVRALSLRHLLEQNMMTICFWISPKRAKRSDATFVRTSATSIRSFVICSFSRKKGLVPGTSVIILDEVQLFPLARQAVKQLVRDGRYHYIETGSLISIKQNTERILVPSEEHRIRMHPMDFEEFLWAKGDTITANAIREAFEHKRSLGDDIHRAIMRSFREYLAVGGMPQVVASFVSGETFEQVDFAKQSILSLYEEICTNTTVNRMGASRQCFGPYLSSWELRACVSSSLSCTKTHDMIVW